MVVESHVKNPVPSPVPRETFRSPTLALGWTSETKGTLNPHPPNGEIEMYTVYLVNFGYALEQTYSDVEFAKTAGKVRGFDFAVLRNNTDGTKSTMGHWSIIGGWRPYH
jgi:hypothetical protein